MVLPAFSLAYFLYFLYLGTAGPYLSRYLEDQGHTRDLIGSLAATRVWAATIFAYVLCRLADYHSNRSGLQRLLGITATVAIAGWYWTDSSLWLFAVAAVTGAALGPQIPMLDGGTMDGLGNDKERFGSVRFTGTIGWGLGALLSPMIVTALGLPRGFVWVMAGFMGTYSVMTFFLPDTQVRLERAHPKLPFRIAISHSPLLTVLLAGLLHSIAFGNYEEFSSLHFRDRQATDEQVSLILMVGIIVEVLVFVLAPRFITRTNAISFAIAAASISALRWFLMPHVHGVHQLMALQITHGASFGLWYASAIQLIAACVPAEVRTSGQALLACSITAGMGAGAAIGGVVQDRWGTDVAFHGAAALGCGAALLLIMRASRLRHVTPLVIEVDRA